MTDVGLAAAFLGGLLALLSPCSALLLPAFFAYAFASKAQLLGRTLVFYLGLCTTLVPLGAAGSIVGRVFYGHRDLVVAVGGWTVVVLGVAQILGLGFASRRVQDAAARIRPGSSWTVYLLGTVYGLAGFCAGPVLGSVLTISAVGGHPWYGAALLAVYAFGMAFPIFLLALSWDRLRLGGRRRLRGRAFRVGRLDLHTNSLVSGLFFVLLGALFLAFDGTSALPSVLDVDTEFRAQQWMGEAAAGVSNAAVLLFLAAAVAAGVLVAQLRRPSGRDREDAQDHHEENVGGGG
ncbi:cytochrome c biogenesis CcdA family protein [Actinomadura bangladeshensis]|uniref:Cytochrome c biogenesis protein CcdA n=1 Tax=Actinomadura bangladeshensis TaxID=453573 RepID=A0A4R4NW69_9ACTN|nr:cytochrome c biogenesis CcdA family protein [Actinomadura bangladeshensis]TDC11662.1 cytochrome c biogenesis protein CcdA [Actinomadura bangladeshensis]